jgi:hypothetical protein
MNVSSASSAAAFQEAARQRSVDQSRQVRQEAAQQAVESAQAVKVRNRQAVQQAAAPLGENRISQDIRQMAKRESRREVEANRENNLHRTAEQMAVKFREMARRSESARRVGNSEREGFAAVA